MLTPLPCVTKGCRCVRFVYVCVRACMYLIGEQVLNSIFKASIACSWEVFTSYISVGVQSPNEPQPLKRFTAVWLRKEKIGMGCEDRRESWERKTMLNEQAGGCALRYCYLALAKTVLLHWCSKTLKNLLQKDWFNFFVFMALMLEDLFFFLSLREQQLKIQWNYYLKVCNFNQ